MLLHIGGFETVMLPKLLDLLKEKNFKLITLQEAESDPAYATDADLPSNWGGTFLQQMMRAKHLELPPSKTGSRNLTPSAVDHYFIDFVKEKIALP